MLEQPINHLMCRQEVYLKNSVDWNLVRGYVKSLNWNEIIRFPFPALSEALLCAIRDRVPKRTVMVRTRDKPWFVDRYVFARRAKHRAYRVWSRSRMQANWEEYRVACCYAQRLYVKAERPFNERAQHS